jgi:hypothetical protein
MMMMMMMMMMNLMDCDNHPTINHLAIPEPHFSTLENHPITFTRYTSHAQSQKSNMGLGKSQQRQFHQ